MLIAIILTAKVQADSNIAALVRKGLGLLCTWVEVVFAPCSKLKAFVRLKMDILEYAVTKSE